MKKFAKILFILSLAFSFGMLIFLYSDGSSYYNSNGMPAIYFCFKRFGYDNWFLVPLIASILYFVVSLRGVFVNDEQDTKKKNIIGTACSAIVFIIVLTIAIMAFTGGFEKITGVSEDYIPSYEDYNPNLNNRKEKCAWCGKTVDKDDMIGTWCRDCSNDAFGHNGWYNK